MDLPAAVRTIIESQLVGPQRRLNPTRDGRVADLPCPEEVSR